MTSSWMLVAGALFALMGALAKHLAGQFSGAELAMVRSLVAMVAIGAFMWVRRLTPATAYPQQHFWRSFTGTISLVAYFYAMTQLPLATAITLNYTSPLFLTLLSVVLAKETLNRLQAGALGLGFVGTALVLRPTFSSDQWGVGLLGLASGFFAASAYFNVKKLSDVGEPEWRIVFFFGLFGTIGGALTQAVSGGTFHPVQANNVVPLLAMGLAATLAQLAMTRAYASGNTFLVSTFAYSTVLFAAIAGWWWFDERLPPVAWLGVVIVIGAGILAKLAAPQQDTRPALPAEED
jgi:drug/metabolite transporter (DMT)-like permease